MNRHDLLEKIKDNFNKKLININTNEIEIAVNLLDIEDIKLRFFIGSLIQNKGEKSLPALIKGTCSEIAEVKRSSIYLLGKIILKEKLVVSEEIRNVLAKGLIDEDPKVRKNSALILGDLKDDLVVANLIAALEKEPFDWVKKTIMLSLGKISGETVEKYFQLYKAETDLEKETLLKILDRLSNETSNIKLSENLPQKYLVELWTYIGLEKILIDETKEKLGIQCNQVDQGILSLKTDSVLDLLKIRTFTELLFPEKIIKVDDIESIEKKAIELICNDEFLNKIFACHTGDLNKIRYRLEIRGVNHVIRKSLINTIAKKFGSFSGNFINSPTNYDIEIRLIYKKNSIKLLWKPFTFTDTRFSYRKEDVPASIHPVVAAGLVRILSAESDEKESLLDPFCGSGTLLIESAIENEYKKIIGVDISDKAIAAANKNVLISGFKNITFIHSDFRKVSLSPVDRIITNMPFGIRVGDHKKNHALYNDFFSTIVNKVDAGSVAVIYTQEIALTNKIIRKYSNTIILTKFIRLDVGGLKPAVFVLKKL